MGRFEQNVHHGSAVRTAAPRMEVHLGAADLAAELAADIRAGLGSRPRSLPARWLYDPAGCELFERITTLPEYYPTRAERAVLAAHAGDIAARCGATTLVELGSGTSEKTGWLLRALADAGTLERFVAFDVAEPTLRSALDAIAADHPGVELVGVVGDFQRHLRLLPSAGPRLVAFLGGTIGNLSPPGRAQFLADLAATLRPGETLLLGTDLVRDRGRLEAAYDDPDGVTAAFERNVLAVVNDQLGGHFDLASFDYAARWDDHNGQVEMVLRSRRDQQVAIDALDLVVDFDAGEEILTEISAKFTLPQVRAELTVAGFEPDESWTDPAGDFAVTLAMREEDRPEPTWRRTASHGVTGRSTVAAPAAPDDVAAGSSAGAPEPTAEGYRRVRDATEALAAPLSAEDQTVQTMPDVSPTKWHRAHVTWFFEQFLLLGGDAGHVPVAPEYLYLFNSYYEGAGPRHPRVERGLLTRPGVAEITAYRQRVDEAMADLLDDPARSGVDVDLVELGLHHEQQHQELLLMDIKHVLATNPLRPAYRSGSQRHSTVAPVRWLGVDGGLVDVGHPGSGFCFDNEAPRHRAWLEPFEIADRLVTAGEWLDFMADGGYERPDLWLSEGWAAIQAQGWRAPLYWDRAGDGTVGGLYTLEGARPVDPADPVAHVSYYEAEAFARWSGARLPSEAEWETAAARHGAGVADPGGRLHLHPGPVAAGGTGGLSQAFGEVWQWTASAYLPYPGFAPNPGVVGEYNGKFMVSQHVLRGSACITPPGHARMTYRNFFPPGARWAFSGLRLARS